MGDLRIAFAAPTMPFVIGASGMDGRSSGSGGRRDELCEAQRRATLRAPFVNSSLFVETRDYARSSGSPNPNQGYHWGWNAESLFLIGNAMGEAALSLAYPPAALPQVPPSSPPSPLSPPSPPPSQSPVSLAAVYLAQTHVIEVGEYVKDAFKLVGGRPVLLKVQLTGSVLACRACDRDGKDWRGNYARSDWAQFPIEPLERHARPGRTQARRLLHRHGPR